LDCSISTGLSFSECATGAALQYCYAWTVGDNVQGALHMGVGFVGFTVTGERRGHGEKAHHIPTRVITKRMASTTQSSTSSRLRCLSIMELPFFLLHVGAQGKGARFAVVSMPLICGELCVRMLRYRTEVLFYASARSQRDRVGLSADSKRSGT
jgi:hypothetical protein